VEKDLYFYHPDHLGSSTYVTDTQGKLYEHLEYFPYGETWVEEATNTQRTPYLFTSKELDEETGLYYFGARYYDPRTSVWQSTDSLLGKYLPSTDPEQVHRMPGLGGIYNTANLTLYSYATRNPLSFRDPDGLATIVIDPGHGDVTEPGKGVDPGAPGIVGRTAAEKDQTLRLAKAIGAGLEKLGHKVILTRTGEVTEQRERFQWRADISNKAKADFFVSVHVNSGAPPEVNYFMVGYISEPGKKLAESIAASVVNKAFSKSVAERHTYQVLARTLAPAVLIEAGFIANPENEKIITNQTFIDQIVKGIHEGIRKVTEREPREKER
jgi:RHS repeat-associated protein